MKKAKEERKNEIKRKQRRNQSRIIVESKLHAELSGMKYLSLCEFKGKADISSCFLFPRTGLQGDVAHLTLTFARRETFCFPEYIFNLCLLPTKHPNDCYYSHTILIATV